MKGYWIAHVTVTDPDTYQSYADAAPQAFKKYNARVLARGGRHQQLEGEGRARNVVIEFASFEDAVACYNSPEYQKAAKIRQANSIGEILIVEGAA